MTNAGKTINIIETLPSNNQAQTHTHTGTTCGFAKLNEPPIANFAKCVGTKTKENEIY